MRYIVVPVAPNKKKPEEKVFYLRDLHTGLLSLAHYTTYERAEKVAKSKNAS
jgi:hypothetical protein